MSDDATDAGAPRADALHEYPPRRATGPDEARWFLDLEGFPRAGRSHHLVDQGGRLVARWTAVGAPGIPRARASFVLSDPDAPHDPALDDALDLGELALVADLLAGRAGDASLPATERRALLDEASAALELAIARAPDDGSPASAERFRSARGRDAWAREPGRFTRARLQAAADAHARRARALGAAPPERDDRARALHAIALLRAQLAPLLHALAHDADGAIARSLRPRDEDWGRVFVGPAAEVARRAYAAHAAGPHDLALPDAAQTELVCHLAPAGMLADENELSRHFPAGYQAVAHLLVPHRVWTRWKWVRPGETLGLAHDGLVWCDDHWAWFPRPYRALAPLAGGGPPDGPPAATPDGPPDATPPVTPR